uniref:Uncharacterized protein n=1 Tax=Molossus molossus TaxID=27622 RepID=A0A7J8I9U6_MOLMO|nr:hypothetical protein HJG59_010647 [Molossus molossus]
MAAPASCPRGWLFLFPALGSWASLKNRMSFCSWFLFILFFFFFLMVQFSDISRTVLRAEGGHGSRSLSPPLAPEQEGGTRRRIPPLRGRGLCCPGQGLSPGTLGQFGAEAERTMSPTLRK